jgi:hypothetical protein
MPIFAMSKALALQEDPLVKNSNNFEIGDGDALEISVTI